MKNTVLLLILTSPALVSLAQQRDPIKDLMNCYGITEENLGYKPKGYWLRYPLPEQIPYALPAFNDLMAAPQYIYDYVNTAALSVEDFLHPDYLKKNHDALLRLGFYTGVMHQSSEFRAYSASLWAEPDSKDPLMQAIKDMYASAGRVFTYNRMGEKGEFPLNEKDLQIALQGLHPSIQMQLAIALINMTEAWRFTQIGMRNVDYKDAVKAWRIRHLGETQFDGMEYYPELENIAKSIDMNSIYYAGLKLTSIAQQLADTLIALKNVKKDIKWKEQNFEWITPLGRIVISGTKNDIHHYTDAFLVIDLGGDDVYNGPAGATPSLQIPLSLFIDLDGNDQYLNEDEFSPAQGAALFGAAMLYDVNGNDLYKSKRLSQGAAMFGFGILADMNGNDQYDMWTSGQGGAYFGVGLAIDNTGDDKYSIWGDGQGYGGVGGMGALINRTGNDHYYAEKDTSVIFRSDFWHSEKGQYNYNYVQGCGIGRRGDVTDGHSWAGGMGLLVDSDGNDKYEAGGWSQGCGYWYGMGFLMDKRGDDEYISTHWAQAAGAHFAIGCLFDEGGNDKHVNWGKLAAGIGFAHDYVISIFYNKGGNDYYKVHNDGFGYAINMSQVFFIDTEGDDTYISGKGKHFGWNNFESQNPPGISSVYHLYSDQICLFADLGGKDSYLVEDFESKNQHADERIKDGSEIQIPNAEERAKLTSKRYYGLGVDYNTSDVFSVEYFRNKMKPRFDEFK